MDTVRSLPRKKLARRVIKNLPRAGIRRNCSSFATQFLMSLNIDLTYPEFLNQLAPKSHPKAIGESDIDERGLPLHTTNRSFARVARSPSAE
jgi:hypothetical protein